MPKELEPNQDLKINAGLVGMWKKAGLRVKSFKATKKGHNEIWAGKFKTKNAILQMSVNKFGFVFYHAGNKSVNIGRLDKQRKIIDWMKAIIRNAPWAESVNERKLSSQQKKAILIAIEMSGNMTGATKKIEKIKKGLSKDKKVRDALQLANESVNEDIVRDEVHAKTKRELKAAIAKSMKEILQGKTPKYDIINGMTGEMIGWKDGHDYIWQPSAIPYAERELK